MSRHASFLLGQALEALTAIVDAPDLDTAVAVASAALAGIVPSDADWAGVERGAKASLIGDGAATPRVAQTGQQVLQRLGSGAADECATGTPTPEAAPSPVLRALVDSPMCGNPNGGYVCVRDAHPRRPGDHVYIRPQQMKGGGRYEPLLGLVAEGNQQEGQQGLGTCSPEFAWRARFWMKVRVAPADSCWDWLAALDRYGYGKFAIDHRTFITSHRAAFLLAGREIPEGLHLDHLCRNRACCNPGHLEPVTNAENHHRGYWANRTHCENGHPWNEENTGVANSSKNPRYCRACRRDRRQRSNRTALSTMTGGNS